MDLNSIFNELKSASEKINNTTDEAVIFSDEFMQKHTKFNSLDDLFNNSPFKINDLSEIDNLNEQELNNYIKSVTKFNSWEEFENCSLDEIVENKLNEYGL